VSLTGPTASKNEMVAGKNFQARFPGTMRVEKQLLYWIKGQNDRSTEANQTTRWLTFSGLT